LGGGGGGGVNPKIHIETEYDGAGSKKAKDDLNKLGKDAQRLNQQLAQGLTNLLPGRLGAILRLGSIAGGITAVGAAMTATVVTGVKYNAMLEQVGVAFETLLGSASAARIRLAELEKFAAETPFEMEGVVNANRILQVMSDGALATKEAMRLVGDAAASTGRDFQEVAFWIGRVYAGLQSGTPIGEATLRLIEMGLIGGNTAQKLNRLAESGEAVGKAGKVIEDTFSKFAGTMEKQSKTLTGRLSTLNDSYKQFAGALTEGLADPFKDLVLSSTKLLDNLKEAVIQYGKTAAGSAALLSSSSPATGMKAEDIGLWATVTEGITKAIVTANVETGAWLERVTGLNVGYENVRETLRSLAIIAEDAAKPAFTPLPPKPKAVPAEVNEEKERAKALALAAADAERQRAQKRALSIRLEADYERMIYQFRQATQTAEQNWALDDEDRRRIKLEALNAEVELNRDLVDSLRAQAALERDPEEKVRLETRADEVEQRTSGLEFLAQQQSASEWQAGWQGAMAEVNASWGSFSAQIASSFSGVWNTALDSVSSGLTAMALQTQGWQQQLARIPQTILVSIVGAIIKMAVTWVAQQIFMATAGKLIQAAGLKATAVIAAGYSAIWSAPAALANMATYGGAAIAAPGFAAEGIAATQAVALGGSAVSAQAGGYTGSGRDDQIAGYVHRNEYVIPADAVRAMGGPTATQQIVAALSTGGGRREVNQNINLLLDRDEFADQMRRGIGSIAMEALARNTLRLSV